MRAFHIVSIAAFLGAALLTAPVAMALEEAQVKQLGSAAGSWLESSTMGSVGDVDVDGTKMHLKVIYAGKDAKDRDMRVLSIDGNGQRSCHGLFKDGSTWTPASYAITC